MTPKLSVIIPAYNVAGYLEKCLDSVLSQTFTDFEVILVDDGSTDETPAICDRYLQKDSRLIVVHKENEGVSVARNTGIEKARGEYFLFFDGDDFVEPYACEELYKLAKDKEVDTVIYGYHRFENGKIKETCRPIFEAGYYEGDAILTQLLPRFVGLSCDNINRWLKREEKALYVENPALWRTLVSSKVIKDNNIRFNRNLKVGEDTIFISEYLSFASRCYVHPKCYYYLVTRETSTIYNYEKNPIAKLDGKIKLLDARNELTEKIRKHCKFDIDAYWRGTVVMSCMELAFLLAKKHPEYGFHKRYRFFLDYVRIEDVKKTIRNFQLTIVPGIIVLPFLLLKWKLYLILFICVSMLHLVHYEFQRT